MKPKSRKEILDICQEHFWDYSKLTKFLIVISVVLVSSDICIISFEIGVADIIRHYIWNNCGMGYFVEHIFSIYIL